MLPGEHSVAELLLGDAEVGWVGGRADGRPGEVCADWGRALESFLLLKVLEPLNPDIQRSPHQAV